MARLILIIVVLSVTTYAQAQYIDFFQSFTTFLQPHTTRRPDTTKRADKQTNKRYQDSIYFETDEFIKQRQNGRTVDPYTTIKPKKTKTTRKPARIQEKSYEYNQINKDVYTTQRYYIAQMIPSVTNNPLLYRPGVKPAVVDENRPPITNRPVTNPILTPDEDTAGIEIGPDEDDMTEAEKRRYIEIAEQKCEEYKSAYKKKIVALPLATVHRAPGVELEVDTCAPSTAPLIIGGKVVRIKEFPHMGLVGWKNIQKSGYKWKCGGSLVSERYVLTAGHCTYYDKDYNVISGPPSAVQLGSSHIDGNDALVVNIMSVIRHPKYKARRSYYDVALIKLETTVTFSESISPACLGVPPPVGNRVITTGWGRTEFGGDSSHELRGVSIPIWDMNECRAVWGTSRKLPEGPSAASQLCAGERGGGKDTCQGDSGGPAQIQDGCTWRVVAVTSVGRSCGAAETPALYAKIPRAFIAAEIFSNVKLNNNNDNRNNNNGNRNNNNANRNDNNGNRNNNNGNINNNNNGNRNNNQGFDNGNNQNDNQGFYNGHNNENGNRNNNDDNRNNQGFNDNRDEVRRPGNHQYIGGSTENQQINNWSNSNLVNRPGNHQSINRVINQNNNNSPGNQGNRNTQYESSAGDEINRPGNHQTVDNRYQPVNYFVTSQTGHEDEIRLGNHQTVDNKRGDAVNFFVTSHINDREVGISRLGNHQTVENQRITAPNYFITSQSTGSEDNVRLPGNHQRIPNPEVNKFSDSENSESNHDTVIQVNTQINNRYNQNNNYGIAAINEQAYNEQGYINTSNNPAQTYSHFGYQNSDSTTESVYNSNNNGYNQNNYNGFAVANRPWWNR